MFWIDLKHGFRLLRKNRSFAAVVIAALAVTIGVNVTLFALIDALMWRNLPVREPENLVGIYGVVRGKTYDGVFSRTEYAYYKERSAVFSHITAHYSTASLFLDGQEINGAAVSGNFFDVLGIKPSLGRFFVAEEDAADARAPVAVLSHQMWERRFGGDMNILGKSIQMNGVSFSVIGVAPAGFRGVYAAGIANDLWIPLSMSSVAYRWCDSKEPACHFLDLIGRLNPGKSLDQAHSELMTLTAHVEAQFPKVLQQKGLVVSSLQGLRPTDRSEVAAMVRLLGIAAFVLLLIACTNVSGLLLAQTSARRKEMAIRIALGSSRFMVFRQMFTESAMLGCLGGVGGLLIAFWLNRPLSAFQLTSSTNYYADLRIDLPAMFYTAGLVMISAFLSTIVPALKLTGQNLFPFLKDHDPGGGNKSPKVHDLLIVAQIAMSLALLVASALVVVSLQNIYKGPGFDPSRLAFVRITPARIGLPPAVSQGLQRDILERFSALPGVESVSLADSAPWTPGALRSVALPGQEPVREEDKYFVRFNAIGPKYLSTLQAPLIGGREFTDADREGAPPVVIINQSLAKRMFPDGDAVGKMLMIRKAPFTIVGVTKNAQYHVSSDQTPPFFYIPYWQSSNGTDARFCIRTTSAPETALSAIRRAVRETRQDLPMSEEITMKQGLERNFSSVHFTGNILLLVSGIACFLSMMGLYSLISYSVVQRTREIGIRIAFGAKRGDILKLMLLRGFRLVLIGLFVGVLLALTCANMLSSLLYGTSSTDTTILAGAAIALMSISMFANFIPARRATRVDPIKSIREQ